MDHPIVLHLPGSVFCAMTDHSGEGFYGPKTEAILSGLVRHWIDTTKAAPRPWLDEDDADDADDTDASTNSTGAPSTSRGYQWKQLFLPNGTELRAIYGGRSTYAQVEDERIISDGSPTTPSRLANAQGCGTRNAWQTVWLRFPGSTRWQRAADCRQ
nr:hypothetical protein [uncultured Duganella sp.]